MAEDQVRLRSDSVAARRIVASFLDFLRSVEVVDGVDSEGLEVAAQCLTEIFDLRSGSEKLSKVSLVDVITQSTHSHEKSDLKKSSTPELDSQNVYRQFVEGLESAGFFSSGTSENRVPQAESTFQETLKAYKGKDESELLAEAFKAQGNGSMASHRYVEAIELYTLAISLSSNNAIYFANRAAAHTQAGNHGAAITDCHKAIEINPRYSKAYSRLGLVHYSQGRYLDAVEWFTKALEVDPSNTSASDNLQSARQKLVEALRGSSQYQEPGACVVNVTAQFETSDSENSSPARNSDAQAASGATAEEQTQEQHPQDHEREARRDGSSEARTNPPEFQPDGLSGLLQCVMQGIQQGGAGLENLVPEVANMVRGFPAENFASGATATFDFAETLQSAIQNLGIPASQAQRNQNSSQQQQQQNQNQSSQE
ncbi:small glutamine-rich tetratricopeptide repeat-containing protein-like [Selaginella moellendorffii]|uniref:small glutamine-rich tetratricopeptide repeat-containing protein-like n=1 Tax=Selaginella moellendorffii TaxID=88036 RepID=UPI000D1C4211|nr:small glutamine-rich tetratricopeptide repeat-containing protein-like [Selaginella moellendorffii]|eukprot:XP_024532682.1 small glutamine-rich tetratricopeptide repeat-containing protein-like [Selaginella moellendorffii]